MASMASLAFQLPNLPTSRYDLMTWWPVSMTCLKHSQDFSRHHVELLARSAWPCRAAHIVAVLQVQKDSERLWHSMAFYGILTGWRTHKEVGNGWDMMRLSDWHVPTRAFSNWPASSKFTQYSVTHWKLWKVSANHRLSVLLFESSEMDSTRSAFNLWLLPW